MFLDTDILDFNVTKAKERRGRNKDEIVMKKRLVTAGEKKKLVICAQMKENKAGDGYDKTVQGCFNHSCTL